MFAAHLEKNLYAIAHQLAIYDQNQKTRNRKDSCVDSGIEHWSPTTSQCEVNIEDEVLKELQVTRQVPFRDYICHRCFQKGHMIQHCPTKDYSKEKTPYQGDRLSIGLFRCNNCRHYWRSEKARANMPQDCRHCTASVFPTRMWPKRSF